MMNERELYDTIAIYLKQRDNERGAMDAATIEVLRVAIEKAIDVLSPLDETPQVYMAMDLLWQAIKKSGLNYGT